MRLQEAGWVYLLIYACFVGLACETHETESLPGQAEEKTLLPFDELAERVPAESLFEYPGLCMLTHKPLVVLYDEHVYHACEHVEPTLILYEDGLVFFRQGKGRETRTYRARLSDKDMYELQEQIISAGFMDEEHGFLSLKKRIRTTSRCYPPPPNRILIRLGERWKCVETDVDEYRALLSENLVAFFAVRRMLNGFDTKNKRQWPYDIEVILQYTGWLPRQRGVPCGYEPWPMQLPPIPVKPAAKNPEPLRFKIPGKYEPILAEAAGSLRPICYGGHIWYLCLRYNFPEGAYLKRLVEAVWPRRPRIRL